MQKLLRKFVLKRLESYTQKLLETHRPKVIAITGSVGKTSTKQAIAHFLGDKYRVLVHSGNYNTDFGLPLSLFDLDAPVKTSNPMSWLRIFKTMDAAIKSQDYPYDAVVLEMGADKPGDIERFMSYITPDIGVVTAVAKVHIEEFKTIDAILREKWLLAEGSSRVFFNHDDERLRDKAESRERMHGYGLAPADYWMDLKHFNGMEGWSGEMHLKDKTVSVTVPVVARQSVYGLLAGAAIASKLGVEQDDILNLLKSWQQPAGRMRVLSGKNDSIILDDSYNSSPYASVAALDALAQFPGRKLAILGSMNELGEYEESGHKLVGKHCQFLGSLVTIGRAANSYLAVAAEKAGLDKDSIHTCATPYEAGELTASLLQPGDVVLVKGSQNGVFAEESIKSLLADSADVAQLVRQSEDWMAKKQEQFS